MQLNEHERREIMNRFRLLLLTTIVAAVTVLFSGINVTFAAPAPPAEQPGASNVPPDVAAARKAAATRARAKRDAMLKQREESKKFIKGVVEGQQIPAAPGTGGAK
jgi:hypothetical protein